MRLIGYFNKCMMCAVSDFTNRYDTLIINSIENQWYSSKDNKGVHDNTIIVIKSCTPLHFEHVEAEYFFNNKSDIVNVTIKEYEKSCYNELGEDTYNIKDAKEFTISTKDIVQSLED